MKQLQELAIFLLVAATFPAVSTTIVGFFIACVTSLTFSDVTSSGAFWVLYFIATVVVMIYTGCALWEPKYQNQTPEDIEREMEVEKKRQELHALRMQRHFSM